MDKISLINKFLQDHSNNFLLYQTITAIFWLAVGYVFNLFLIKPFKFLYENFNNVNNNFFISLCNVYTLFKKEKEIRFSISYLFRIKIGGKYLLIKGSRIPNQYQPIGGVYKYYPAFISTIRQWGIKDDKHMEIDDNSKLDLRIRVPIKNASKVIKWFQSRKEREVSIFREYSEELLIPYGLSDDYIKNFRAEYLKTVTTTKTPSSSHFKCCEILIADIFEIHLTSKEEEEIENKIKNSNCALILVNEDTIEKGYLINSKGEKMSIAGNVKWSL